MKKILYAITIVFLLLLGLTVSVYAENEGYFNGSDVYSNGEIEFFSNRDDEDKLYKLNLSDMSEEKILDEHVISMVNKDEFLYLLVYADGKSTLLEFNTKDGSYLLQKEFDVLVTNIALRGDILYYVKDRSIFAYNIENQEDFLLVENGTIDLMLFTEYDTLKYYTKNDGETGYIENTYNFKKKTTSDGMSLLSSYSPRLTEPSTSNKYYMHTSYGGLNECIHISDGSVMPNCVGYAWGRSYENLGSRPSLSKANAENWYGYSDGYSRGTTPALGAVAVWAKGVVGNGNDGAGHVAVVEVINGDAVTTSESGYGSFYFKTVTRSASNSNFSASSSYSFLGFIYVCGNDVVVDDYLDLGTNFYAVILQRQAWIPITNDDDGFIRLHTEMGKSNQLWKFVRQDDGSYLILSAYNGKALEVYQGITYDGNPVAACNEDWGGYYQRWYIYQQSNGYVIMSKHFKEYELVLDLRHDIKTDGGEVITFRRNNSDVQIWGIYKGEEVQLGRPTLTIEAGTSASPSKFDWSNVYGETGYNLRIIDTNSNEEVNSQWGLAGTTAEVILPAGSYKAYVDAYNYFGYKGGNDVYFTVKDATFSVNFNSNGGTTPTASKSVTYHETYGELPVPTKVGYTFKGWYTEPSGGTQITSDTKVTITSAQTLYARWEKIVPSLVATVTKSGATHTISISAQSIDSCEMAVVGYSGNRMAAVQKVTYSGKNTDVILNGDFDEIKIMAWEDLVSMKPLCEAEVIPASAWIG